jgi:hypothetical protein
LPVVRFPRVGQSGTGRRVATGAVPAMRGGDDVGCVPAEFQTVASISAPVTADTAARSVRATRSGRARRRNRARPRPAARRIRCGPDRSHATHNPVAGGGRELRVSGPEVLPRRHSGRNPAIAQAAPGLPPCQATRISSGLSEDSLEERSQAAAIASMRLSCWSQRLLISKSVTLSLTRSVRTCPSRRFPVFPVADMLPGGCMRGSCRRSTCVITRRG